MAKKGSGRMESVGVGTGLGQFLNQVEDQVRTAKTQRDTTVRSLLVIRDKANRLLADLGHIVTQLPVPGLKRRVGRPARTEGSAVPPSVKATGGKAKRGGMSAEGRARIAEAQKKRWALIKAGKKTGK